MTAIDKLPSIFKSNGGLYRVLPSDLVVGKTIVIGSDGKWTTVSPLTPESDPGDFPDLSSKYFPLTSTDPVVISAPGGVFLTGDFEVIGDEHFQGDVYFGFATGGGFTTTAEIDGGTGAASFDSGQFSTDGSGNVTAVSYTGSGVGLTGVAHQTIDTQTNLDAASAPLSGQLVYCTTNASFRIGDGTDVYSNLTGFGVFGSFSGIPAMCLYGDGLTLLLPADIKNGTTGDARGQGAVDLQVSRSHSWQVSGSNGSLLAGVSSATRGLVTFAIGTLCNSLNQNSVVMGEGSNGLGHAGFVYGVNSSVCSFAFVAGNNCQSGYLPRTCTTSGNVATIPGNVLSEWDGALNALVFSLGDYTVNTGKDATVLSVVSTAFDGTNTNITFGGTVTFGAGTRNIIATTVGRYSFAGGQYAVSTKWGSFVRAPGKSLVPGDRQKSEVYLYANTTDATQTELTLTGVTPSGTADGISNRYILAANKSYAGKARITGKQVSSANVFMAEIMFVVVNNGGTISIVEGPRTDMNPATWGGVVLAVDSGVAVSGSFALQVLVTGAAATSIGWFATLEVNEVMN